MHALFCTFFGFGSAKVIEIGYDLTELQSNVRINTATFYKPRQKRRF